MSNLFRLTKSIIGLEKETFTKGVLLEVARKSHANGIPVYTMISLINARLNFLKIPNISLNIEGWIPSENSFYGINSSLNDNSELWISADPYILHEAKIENIIFGMALREALTDAEKQSLFLQCKIAGIPENVSSILLQKILSFKDDIDSQIRYIVEHNRDHERPGYSADNNYKDPRDGKTYKTIIIGDQVWMAENLAWLPEISEFRWRSGFPAYHVYSYNGNNVLEAMRNKNFATYGVLYNLAAARISSPPGWHLPTYDEWEALIDHIGSIEDAGGKLKSKAEWVHPNTGATDEFGFSALPGGYMGSAGTFGDLHGFGNFWTSSEYNSETALYFLLAFDKAMLYRGTLDKEFCLSVRCVRD